MNSHRDGDEAYQVSAQGYEEGGTESPWSARVREITSHGVEIHVHRNSFTRASLIRKGEFGDVILKEYREVWSKSAKE